MAPQPWLGTPSWMNCAIPRLVAAGLAQPVGNVIRARNPPSDDSSSRIDPL